MMNDELFQQKQEAIDLLRKRLTPDVRRQLADVDDRLLSYFDDCAEHSSNVFADENDRHSMWELLCAAKFLRMFRTYHFNTKQVQYFIKLREGIWQREGKAWRYVSGGLKLPSNSGAKVYRWQPFQVFVLATVFGFFAWVNTHVEAGTKDELLDTEREKDGFIWDFRRMISEFILYGPRKIDKTGLSSFIQLVFFLFGDFNSEIYSLAMTSDQSKILYDRTKFMLKQLNVSEEGNALFRMNEKLTDWLPKYRAEIRNSKIVPLTGGGKAPDGTNTELLNWDEFGSSPYINGKSDMQAHINVCQSSMGMRRQPLTFGTTTAGTITSGPFIEMLQGRHELLLQEFKYETGEATPSITTDSQMCLLLEPDEYEKVNEEYVITSLPMRRKINPMLGITVQYDFYDREMLKAREDGEQKYAECISKLFNVYRSLKVTKWLQGDQVRPRQCERRIMDCWASQGWRVFCGLDFGGTDDLWAAGYLAVNYEQQNPVNRFFFDVDLWVTEKAFLESPNRPLYEMWVRDGWLHVCPGEVFSHEMAVNQIMYRAGYNERGELCVPPEHQIDIRLFTYDPAQSIQPINTLKAWLQSLGIDPDGIKRMVVAVPQTFVNFNGLIQEVEYMLLNAEPWLQLSANPAIPWMFQNCKIEISPNELKKVLKSGQNCKVDGIHALLDAMYGFDFTEGQVQV